MALVPDQKFSTFQDGGDVQVGDTIVGLRLGINTKFNYTGELPPGYVVAIDQGGTGATTAAGARDNLGLGTMAVQNSNAVLITGGTAALNSGQVVAAPLNPTDLVNKQYVDSISTGVQSVVGTLNRIAVDSSDPENPIVDIAATYVGQASITTLGTIITGVWNATPMDLTTYVTGILAILNGGTGVNSVTTAPAATAWAGWDANLNLSANNFLAGTQLVTTSGSTTNLTVSSPFQTIFSGAAAQTVSLPAVATLVNGQSFKLINDSSNAIFINSSGANSVVIMQPFTQTTLTFNGVVGTTAASWDLQYTSNTIGVQSITGTANQVIASSPTGNITLSLPQDIATTSSPTFNNLNLTGGIITDTNGNTVWKMNATPSAINYLQTVNSGTGTAVQLSAAGSDPNIQITVLPKGDGAFVVGSTATVNQQIFYSGAAYQHQTIFSYPSSAATRAVAWQDAGGTVAYLSDIAANGTVNPGTINQLAYYGSTGNAVSGLPLNPNSVLVSDGASFPSLSTTLPNGLAMGTPASITLTNGTGLVPSTGLAATGTPSSSTYLRGDNTWAAAPTTSLGITSFQNITASQTMTANSGYNNVASTTVALALPATSAVGDMLLIMNNTLFPFTVTQGSGQLIRIGANATTPGASGFLGVNDANTALWRWCNIFSVNLS